MKAWFRKWWVLLLLAVGCAALSSTWNSKSTSPRRFEFGPSLAEGPVRPQLVAGWDAMILLAPDGSLWAWGGMRNQLEGVLPTRMRATSPVRVGTDTDWQRATVGALGVLAVKTNGTLWGWGKSPEGELLTVSKTTGLPPRQLGKDTDWADMHMGHGHVLALKRNGSLWAWGRNTYGAVGDGSGTNVLVPTHILPGTKWRQVDGPAFNSFGIQTDGTIWGWGHELVSGTKSHLLTPVQLDPGTNWSTLAAGDFAVLAIRTDGTLWICGQNIARFAAGAAVRASPHMVQVGSDTDWSEVHAGGSYFVARKKNGSWWSCGENQHGQLGLGTTSHRPVPLPDRLPLRFEPWAFATSIGGTTALLAKDGTLWTWGIRAGEPEGRTWAFRLQAWWKVLSGGGRSSSVSYTPVYSQDTHPRFIWELPPSVKTALGTNAPNSPKSAP